MKTFWVDTLRSKPSKKKLKGTGPCLMRVSVAHLNDYNFLTTKEKGKTPKKRPKKKQKTKKRKNKKKKKKKEKKSRRASSLGPKPSSFFFCCFVSFPFLASNRPKTLFFSPRKGHFMFVFACLPLFSLSLFWPPPFFTFSFSVSLFFSVFLPSCLSFLFYLASGFLFFFAFSFFFVFVSWKEQHQSIQSQSFPSSIFSLFWFPVLSSFRNPSFLSLFSWF